MYSTQISAFGSYLVASTDKGVTNIFFYEVEKNHAVEALLTYWPQAKLIKKEMPVHKAVQNFFQNSGKKKSTKRIALHLKGTPFQIKIWEALLKIPEGALISYASVAKAAGTTGHRAVGTAIGANPIAYLIPCHRVIKSVGGIGEYRWGSVRKMAMIGHESARHEKRSKKHTTRNSG